MRNRHKYGAKPTVVDGIRFASKGEAGRYSELKLLERSSMIRKLELQPRFPLTVNGKNCGTYVADFRYEDGPPTLAWIAVEDFKGFDTPVSKLKRKLVEAIYGITITVVRK